MSKGAAMADRVSLYMEQWRRERPDLDPSPMGIVGRLSRANEIIGRSVSAYFATHDLQRGEFDVLATLRRSGRPFTLTPGDLAKSTMVTNAAMTNRLTRLEAKGLLERRTDTSNRRNVLVSLTGEGLELVDRVVEGHFDNEQQVLAPLTTAEREQLATLLERLLEASGDLADPS